MSISSLTTHAAQLLAYFDGQKAEIDAAVAAAKAAAPTRSTVNFYIDPIAGNDANGGVTEAAPVATWAGLLARMGAFSDRFFRSWRINIACDAPAPINITADLGMEWSTIMFTGAWNPRAIASPLPRPKLQMIAVAGIGGAAGYAVSNAIIGANVLLRLSDLEVITAANTSPQLPVNTHFGILRNGHGQRLIAENIKITVQATPLNDRRLDFLYLWNVEIIREASGAGVPLIINPHLHTSRYYLEQITLPAGENLPDVLGITEWDANGYAVGISSNADLSEVVG
jgi:hypothetical protein